MKAPLIAGLLSSNAVRHYRSVEKMFACATAFCKNATCSLIGRKPTVCIFQRYFKFYRATHS